MNLGERTTVLQEKLKDPKIQDDIEELYQELIDVLIEHNQLYYQKNAPIISDEEYDFLFDQLKKIEETHPYLISKDSPTQNLIGQLSEGFEKVHHKVKLASLENSYNAEDLKKFDEKIQKIVKKSDFSSPLYLIEPKYDGLSVELIYKKGKLIQASTRGDGDIGENITQNVKTIKNLPRFLENAPYLLAVRGEIMMRKSILKQLNQEREAKGKEFFANTRNAAAGSIKLLDHQAVTERQLECFVYDLLYAENEAGEVVEYTLKDFPKIDLNLPLSSIDEVIKTCMNPETKSFLEQQDFDFDGLVIKLQDQKKENKSESLREIIGTTNHHPKRAIAYKFPAKQVETQILSLDFQIGRTGIITPVANLQPVFLSGAEISRVSLHNFDFITQKDIRKGDYIWIQRSGEVIPYVTGVIKDRRNGEEELITPPLFCPKCSAPIYKIENFYYCTNPRCTAQLREKILYFVSKEGMNISGFWESVVDLMIDHNLIKDPADIYTILQLETQIFLRKIPWFWNRKIEELIKELEASKKNEVWRLINALGIPNIGKKLAQDIETFLQEYKVQTLEETWEILWDSEKIKKLHGIGEKTLLSLTIFLQDENNQLLLQKLKKLGITCSFTQKEKKEKVWFCITGSFPFTRENLISIFETQGYEFHETLKKDTQYLLCGEKPWSKKQKAQELGITILEHREQISDFFPFLKELKQPEKHNNTTPLITQGSLF